MVDAGQLEPPSPERAGRLLGWRILGGFWAVLFGAVGIGAICLQIAGPPVRTANLAPPAVQTRTQPLPAAPASAPNPQASPLGGTAATQQDPRLAGPAAPEFHAPAPTPPSSPALSAAPGRPLDPQPTVEATPRLPDAPPSASKPATEAVAVTPVTGLPDSAQPALLIHYPAGSSLAEADAEKLAAQADPASHNSILAAPAGAPAVATIKYYDVKDHASAQAMGKALQKLGYRWRIEKGSDRTGQPPAAVEVWMPNK